MRARTWTLALLSVCIGCQSAPVRLPLAEPTASAGPSPLATSPAGTPTQEAAPTAERRGAGHVAGDRIFSIDAHLGVPILDRAIFWDGNAEKDNFGLGVNNYWFLSDWFALRATLNANVFKVPGRDTLAGEIEAGGRFYVWDFDTWSVFWDQTGGFEYANDQVPPGGTYWNFTFSFGPGADIPIGDDAHLMLGMRFHHMSNALGRTSARNPSQNEGRFYIEYGWNW
ncbi:MAG: hypothetical protein AB7I19_19430 [Planctomycetota bacterium]